MQFSQMLLAFVLMAIGMQSHAQTESFNGFLETGEHYSALWKISEESGDLIGHVVANRSAAGRLILQSCLPDMMCQVDGARTLELDSGAREQMPLGDLADLASVVFEIERAEVAYMVPVFESGETQLDTRFGALQVDDEQRLLFNQQLVLEHAEKLPTLAEGEKYVAKPNSMQWRIFLTNIRAHILVALNRPVSAPSRQAPQSSAAQVMQAMPVQGNAYLRIVDHYESDAGDVVVLIDLGGTACPALFRVVSVTSSGAVSTPSFGTCSEVARIWQVDRDYLQENHPDSPAAQAQLPVLTMAMTEFRGPFESEQERLQAAMRLQYFEFIDGQIQQQPASVE